MGAIAGIDLGTTNSALAALNDIGKPEIVVNANGERVTPSVVAFTEGKVALVGQQAKGKLSSEPSDVVQFVKRKMGDPSHRYKVGENEYSPVEISSLILKKLKEECVDCGDVNDVIITVPAHFNEVERKSTMDAGELAGLNVLGVINEPTAAAMYYATTVSASGNVVVYDLGGGTFDVTILNVNGDNIDILASKGDGHLGGVDFDSRLTEYILKLAREDTGKELFPDSFFDVMPKEDSEEFRVFVKMMDAAEKTKKQLSVRDEARYRCSLGADNLQFTVARNDFEELISPYLVTTEMLLENALEDAKIDKESIDKVVLVGGSTRIPKVSELLEDFFGFPPEKVINPDESVALGAAIMAGKRILKEGDKTKLSASMIAEVSKTSVLESANKFFGTFSIGHNNARGELMNQNTVIIERGTKLPCEESGDFATVIDGQEKIEVEVTESDEFTTSPDDVTVLGSYKIDLPADCPANSPVKITYGYDENQRLNVSVELPDGNIFEGSLEYDDKGVLSQSELKKAAAKLDSFIVE